LDLASADSTLAHSVPRVILEHRSKGEGNVTGVLPAQRCLDVLELLADKPNGVALTGVADALRIPKSATHRLLSLLADRGYAVRHEETGRYRLTLRLTALGFRFLSETSLTEICQPVLDHLAEKTGELARLAVVDRHALTWVAKAQGARRGLRYDPDMGREVVLHATATGKAWLATLPIEQALALVRERGLGVPDRFGPKAVKSLSALRREIVATRQRGYGIAIDEGEPGTAAVAAAVRRPGAADAPAVATVSIAGPVVRLTAERRERFARDVLDAARELSRLWPACGLSGMPVLLPSAAE
jgi:IclR family acetate operon transcriptional repressor